MISKRLVEEIERQAPKLTGELIEAIRQDKRAEAYHAFATEKLRELAADLYQNLGGWLHSRSEFALEQHYVKVGRDRFHFGIPLEQVIFALTFAKAKLLQFINGSIAGDSSELSLELQLVSSISHFFDKVIYHVAAGYEDARKAAQGAQRSVGETRPKVVSKAHRSHTIPPVEVSEEELNLPISRGGEIGETSG